MTQQQSAKVLFIDDNDEITTLISKYLQMKNYDVVVTNSGENGAALILKHKFDVVLLDISMPRFNGLDVLDRLEKQGKIKDQKIVVLTALDMSKEEVEGLLKSGVHSCLFKPVDMDTLLEAIESSSRKGVYAN